MKARDLIPFLANMEIGATVEQELKTHPRVLYHRVPGGWVVFSSGSAAYVPLNIDSVNDLRINVGQKPLTEEEYAQQNNAEYKKDEEKKEEKPKESKTPAPTAAPQRREKAPNNIADPMTPRPDPVSAPEGPAPGR